MCHLDPHPLISSVPLPFPLEWLPQPAYLVGGAVRDQILRQHSDSPQLPAKWDLDLVLEQSSLQWASDTARRLQGGFVVLDRERQIARIVLGQTTLDIALQVGGSLEADLRHRDFTCNAIALELHSHRLIDPLGGTEDISQRQIRMVHPDNLSDDPLRLLRAYRQAAQLGFVLDPITHTEICQRAPLLNQVAAERVRAEISSLLNASTAGISLLHQAWQDGLLSHWLPALSPQGFHRALAIESLAPPLIQAYPRTFSRLHQPLTDQRPLRSTLVLAALLETDPQVEQTLDRLRFSRAERQAAQKLHHLWPQFQTQIGNPDLEPGDRFLLFQAASTLFPALVLLLRASGIPAADLHPWLDRYEDPQDPLAHQIPLVDGRQVIQALQIKPGPRVGEILATLRLAQARGQISTPQQALSWARHRLQHQD